MIQPGWSGILIPQNCYEIAEAIYLILSGHSFSIVYKVLSGDSSIQFFTTASESKLDDRKHNPAVFVQTDGVQIDEADVRSKYQSGSLLLRFDRYPFVHIIEDQIVIQYFEKPVSNDAITQNIVIYQVIH